MLVVFRGSCIMVSIDWEEYIMINFIIGCVLGFVVATMGFTGIAQALDNGINTVKNVNVSVEK